MVEDVVVVEEVVVVEDVVVAGNVVVVVDGEQPSWGLESVILELATVEKFSRPTVIVDTSRAVLSKSAAWL